MKTSEYYEKNLLGSAAEINFEELLPTQSNLSPDNTISDFTVLGPFVLETEGAFETEYFYEREKVLAEDYLAASGGEKNAVPFIGAAVQNKYYGAAEYRWKEGFRKWGALRFDNAHESCNEALFATEQRNCVYYAATYVNCENAYDAVISSVNSGSTLFLNGEVVLLSPYGKVKGLTTTGVQAAVHFHKGKNLLMFKLRTGYICDTLDLSISNCSIYPLVAKAGRLALSLPKPTGVYFGTKDAPRQSFNAFAAAFADSDGGEIEYSAKGFSEKKTLPAMKAGEVSLVRVTVPIGKEPENTEVKICVSDGSESGEGRVTLQTTPRFDFGGVEHVSSAFHFDTTYHQEQRTYAMGALHITKCILEELERNDYFKAVLSEVDYLHPYFSLYPKHRQLMLDAFKSGRAEADCFYNQPNDLTSSPEGFVRNMIYGQLYHRDVMGRIASIYAPGDVFGHPNQLSQICRKGGCKALAWGKGILGTDRLMRHVSPDGTSLIHDKGFGRQDAERLGVNNYKGSSTFIDAVPAFPTDGGNAWMKDTLNNAQYSVLSEISGSIADDEERFQKENGFSKVEYTSRDITRHHSGVLLTRTDFKQANRLAENLLISAEKFSAIAAAYGAKYPEKALDKAWRQILCAQHHDSVTGTNNEVSFVDLMIEYREAVEIAASVLENAAKFIASGVETEGKKAIFVFNPHPWLRREPCAIECPSEAVLTDSNGKVLPLVADGRGRATFLPQVPPMGYAVFFLSKGEMQKSLGSSETQISNEFFAIKIDPLRGGGIVSLFDKKAKKELIPKGETANTVAVLKEIPDRMETQHEFYTTGHKLLSSSFEAETRCEKNAVFERLTVICRLDTVARIRQEICLYKGVRRIEMKTEVEDYQSCDDLFTVFFPVDIQGAKPVFDDRFAPHVTSKSQRELSFQTHQFLNYSHSVIVPANQWLDFGRTVLLETGSGSINLGMTSLIEKQEPEIVTAGKILLDALTKKAIPVTPFSDEKQSGGMKLCHFNEDLDYADTRFVLSVSGNENKYEEKLLDISTAAAVKKFYAKLNKTGAAVLVVRDSENAYKKPIDVILIKAQSIEKLTALLQNIAAQLAAGSVLKLDAAVSGKLGFAENYGAALFNKGTFCCSVEKGDKINMMLFHTATFYGNSGKVTGAKELIPENKTHSFSYALYPHTGSYREAELYRRAFEFNDPLFAVTDVEQKAAVLPLKKSFLKCDGSFVVTAFKAGGNPTASLKAEEGNILSRGFTLRGFEPNGVASDSKITLCFDIDKLIETDLLEEGEKNLPHAKSSFSLTAAAHSIESRLIKFRLPEQLGEAVLGIEKEPVQPVYVRSWEHDTGSMPLGYLSAMGSIDKKVESLGDCKKRVTVSMVNNHGDAEINGVMKLSATGGILLDKSEIPYCIESLGFKSEPLTVTLPDKGAKGIVYLDYCHEGQQFRDMLEFGFFNPEITLTIENGIPTAEIYNPTGEALSGSMAVASPFETWGLPDSLAAISPSVSEVSLKPFERKKFAFKFDLRESELLCSFWMAIKLMMNGRIHFAFVENHGIHHNYWTHEYYDAMIKRGSGSIEELLRK